MDTRQRDKEKEKEKDVPPGERAPKVSGVDCKSGPGPADDPYGLVVGLLGKIHPYSLLLLNLFLYYVM